MEYLWTFLFVFIAGGVFALTSAMAGAVGGWFAFQRYIHKPYKEEIERHRRAIEEAQNKRV